MSTKHVTCAKARPALSPASNAALPRVLRAAFLLIPCLTWAAAAPEAADVVLTDALVYTVNDAQPWAEAVAILGGRIVAVGTAEAVKPYVGPKTRVRDLDGQMVLPGFIDAHDHPLTGPTVQSGVNLEGVHDLDAAVERIRRYASAHPKESIVRGYGWSPTLFGKNGPTREALDRAVSDRPAVLFDHDAHTIWMNSAAIARSGLERQSDTDSQLVSYFSWDAAGEPAGAAFEPPGILPVLAALGWVQWPNTLLEAIDRTILRAPRVGITTFYDAGVIVPGRHDAVADAFGLLRDLERSGELPVRVTGSVIAQPDIDPAETADDVMRLQADRGSDLLSFRTIKVYVDGVTTYSTGQTLAPYPDGSHGLRYFDDSQLDAIVTEAEEQGISVHFHVDGDGAARQALDALERVGKARGSLRSRHTLCHLTLLDSADIPRFAALNVTANTTPVWMTNIDGWFDHMERVMRIEAVQRAFPFRALLRQGTRVTFGSDLPSSSARDMAPLRQMQYAVTHRPIESPEAGYGPLLPGVMTVAEAVHAYTLAGAYQLGIDDQVGSVEVGKRADLVVLGRNLFAEPLQMLHAVPVVLTMLDGRVTYEAER